MVKRCSIVGCLLGTAVGDAMGLCFENLSKRRGRRLFRDTGGYHFFFGKGMVSDDTEHACMTAQALISSAGDPEKFTVALSWRLRIWLLGLPGGVGSATLRSIIKLWLGFSGETSGVFSAGNGPAMRSPLIGVCHGDNPDKMRDLVRSSTRVTHTDPKATFGAYAAALAAHMASNGQEVPAHEYHGMLQKRLIGEDAGAFLDLMARVTESVEKDQTTPAFAASIGLPNGISGYMYHTIPPVIHCWLRHQNDLGAAVREIIRCGGDTDTTAAIVGAIIGSRTGPEGIPPDWLTHLWEWPRTRKWVETLGEQVAEVCESGSPCSPETLPFYGVIPRNLLFLVILLFHGLRRLMPPY